MRPSRAVRALHPTLALHRRFLGTPEKHEYGGEAAETTRVTLYPDTRPAVPPRGEWAEVDTSFVDDLTFTAPLPQPLPARGSGGPGGEEARRAQQLEAVTDAAREFAMLDTDGMTGAFHPGELNSGPAATDYDMKARRRRMWFSLRAAAAAIAPLFPEPRPDTAGTAVPVTFRGATLGHAVIAASDEASVVLEAVAAAVRSPTPPCLAASIPVGADLVTKQGRRRKGVTIELATPPASVGLAAVLQLQSTLAWLHAASEAAVCVKPRDWDPRRPEEFQRPDLAPLLRSVLAGLAASDWGPGAPAVLRCVTSLCALCTEYGVDTAGYAFLGAEALAAVLEAEPGMLGTTAVSLGLVVTAEHLASPAVRGPLLAAVLRTNLEHTDGPGLLRFLQLLRRMRAVAPDADDVTVAVRAAEQRLRRIVYQRCDVVAEGTEPPAQQYLRGRQGGSAVLPHHRIHMRYAEGLRPVSLTVHNAGAITALLDELLPAAPSGLALDVLRGAAVQLSGRQAATPQAAIDLLRAARRVLGDGRADSSNASLVAVMQSADKVLGEQPGGVVSAADVVCALDAFRAAGHVPRCTGALEVRMMQHGDAASSAEWAAAAGHLVALGSGGELLFAAAAQRPAIATVGLAQAAAAARSPHFAALLDAVDPDVPSAEAVEFVRLLATREAAPRTIKAAVARAIKATTAIPDALPAALVSAAEAALIAGDAVSPLLRHLLAQDCDYAADAERAPLRDALLVAAAVVPVPSKAAHRRALLGGVEARLRAALAAPAALAQCLPQLLQLAAALRGPQPKGQPKGQSQLRVVTVQAMTAAVACHAELAEAPPPPSSGAFEVDHLAAQGRGRTTGAEVEAAIQALDGWAVAEAYLATLNPVPS